MNQYADLSPYYVELSIPQQQLDMLTELNENQFIDIVAAQNRLCGHSALNDLAWDVFVKLDDQLIATNDLNDQEHNLLNHVSNLLQI